MERKCGILMPISALPSKYGIGTLGRAAFDFADFLKAAGQGLWQILPIGPTGFGDSPYSSFSTFAGNPYFIDLELLCEEGLLLQEEAEAANWGGEEEAIDYGKIYVNRFPLLRKAFERGRERDAQELRLFVQREAAWLPDYALFMALKQHFSMLPWTQWPDEDIRLRREGAVERYAQLLADEVEFYSYLQFLFFRQWEKLKTYVNSLDIQIIGDLPIYVAMDSADVWAQPRCFQLDERNVPRAVAGVPPDYFSKSGQLWGNPLYDWEAMRADGYGWWIRRVDGAKRFFDILRIDHFRGFESYWSVPFGEETAINGKWEKGPGMDFVRVLRDWFSQTPIIAEDLGILTPEVEQLLEDSGFPGMKVLEFAFDPAEPSAYLPHKYPRSCVCYVGTHDNETLAQWLESAPAENLDFARRYLGLSEEEGLARGIIRGGMSSVADTFIVQMQDYLGLGAEARMNTPGRPLGNWRWRIKPAAASPALAETLLSMAKMYERN